MLTLYTGDDVIHARNYNVISFTPSILLVDVWRDSIVCPPLFARRNVRPSDALHIRHPSAPPRISNLMRIYAMEGWTWLPRRTFCRLRRSQFEMNWMFMDVLHAYCGRKQIIDLMPSSPSNWACLLHILSLLWFCCPLRVLPMHLPARRS